MPKPLTARQISRLPEGTHRVAPSLYLQVRGGSRLWTFRFSLAGKARYLSLGSVEFMTLDEAVAAAAAARVKVRRDGMDVVAERRVHRVEETTKLTEVRALEPVPIRKSGYTFGDALDEAVDAEAKAWKPDPKGKARWTSPVRRYCECLIAKDVAQITEQMVVDALAPHWEINNTMALRTLGRVICVMGHARRLGWLKGDNPVVLERTKEKLPRVAKARTQHHPAIPLPAVPGFVRELEKHGTDTMPQLFRFLLLSGVRCNEAAGARWSEIDMATRTWTIPGGTVHSRLKRWQHGDHRVPITDSMAAILEARQQVRTDDGDGLVFADDKGQAFDANQLTTLLRKHGFAKGVASVHGMRAALRSFLAAHVDGERVAKELCLHHEIRNDTEQAYDRTDFLETRRGMLAAWDAYVAGRVTLTTATITALPLRNALHAVAA